MHEMLFSWSLNHKKKTIVSQYIFKKLNMGKNSPSKIYLELMRLVSVGITALKKQQERDKNFHSILYNLIINNDY